MNSLSSQNTTTYLITKMPRTKNSKSQPVLSLEAEGAIESVEPTNELLSETPKTESPKKDIFIRNEDGSVNWRKMVKPEHVVVNQQYVSEIERVYGKPVSELAIESLDDKYLLILLAGIKELARLRGISSVNYCNVVATPDFVSVGCRITWKPFEEETQFIVFEDGADATIQNTSGFAKDFLTAIAYNRAFVRAVRNFLNIHITGKDEIGSPKKVSSEEIQSASETDPRSVLAAKIQKGGKTFEDFKAWWASSQGNPDAENWKSVKDIPSNEVWTILGVFKQKAEQRQKAK